MVQGGDRPQSYRRQSVESCDIKALLEHNENRMLARSCSSNGTLTLKRRTNAASDMNSTRRIHPTVTMHLRMVRRGDLFGSSFAYTSDADVDGNIRYSKDGDTFGKARLQD